MKRNDHIKFNLDCSVYGEGIVTDIKDTVVYVKLTVKCKEFPIDTIIIVDKTEIVK